MISKKYKTLISGSGINKIYILFFTSILVVFFEMLGLGSIPIFAYVIVDTESALIKLSEILNYSIDINIGKRKIIILAGLIFLAIFLLKNMFLILIAYIQGKVLKTFSQNASKQLFTHYVNSSYKFFLDTNPSVLIRTVNTDVGLAMNYFLAKINLVRETILVIFILAGLTAIDPLLYGSSFVLFFITTIFFYFLYKKILKNKGKIILVKGAEKIKLLNQSFYSIKEIKLMSRENYFIKVFSKNVDILAGINFISTFITSLPRIVFETLAVFTILSFTILLVLLGKPQELVIPIVSLLVASAARFIPAFNSISNSLSAIRFMQPSFNNVVVNLENLNKDINFHNKLNIQKINKIDLKEKIILDNLTFSYGKHKVINNLSLEITKGSTIGIIGLSGEGKSTLVNLILGLLKPSNGKILIDDQSIEENLKGWQKNIGLIPQNIYLVDDTIKSNICFGLEDEEINDLQFKKALRLSQLETFVESLPEKEFTKVGDSGSNISGGQKQRIAIARALYNDPAMLILDEGTSSLDTKNEEKIISEMDQYKKNKTVIIISHRKNPLKYCDTVHIMKSGKINQTFSIKDLDKIDYLI